MTRVKYYEKYVEPVIGHIIPYLKKNKKIWRLESIAKIAETIKNDSFYEKSDKEKEKIILDFYELLYFLYLHNCYEPVYADHRYLCNNIWFVSSVAKSGRKDVSAYDSMLDAKNKISVAKKYKGIIGLVSRPGFSETYNNVNFSLQDEFFDNEIKGEVLFMVPKKGKFRDFYKAFDYKKYGEYKSNKDINKLRKFFMKLADLTKYHDSSKDKENIYHGAMFLNNELGKEIVGKGVIFRVSDRLREKELKLKEAERPLCEQIDRQATLVEQLKTSAMNKAMEIVSGGFMAAKFKTAQLRAEKVLEAQRVLNELEKKLAKLSAQHKKEYAEYRKEIVGALRRINGLEK
ncbi:MAG: hypothetical protein IKN73_02015 [Alphaproteobacteria bacterium]|nr:hypothetical protein [Alphaproteobacteria bacterium]